MQRKRRFCQLGGLAVVARDGITVTFVVEITSGIINEELIPTNPEHSRRT